MATGGTPPPAYTLNGDVPAGLTFDADNRTISGTPATATAGAVSLTYRGTDGNGATASVAFTVTVNAALSLTGPAADQTYTAGREITAL